MQLDPNELRTRDLYGWMVGLITPRPIAWVSTLSPHGIVNLAPFSYFNGVGANPPTVMFCPANRRDGSPKDTLENIRRTGKFVVNVVTESVAAAMNASSADCEPDVDEFEFTGTAKAESHRVSPPRVRDAAAAFECELHHAIQLGVGPAGANLVIGRIVWMHVSDSILDESGSLVPGELDTIGRLGGTGYSRIRDRFDLPRPPKPTSGGSS